MYTVEVKAIYGWTLHSTHDSYRDAVDQADMVHGRVRAQERRAIIDVCGDEIAVRWDGNVWVSPCNGQQWSRAADAMACELRAHLLACGLRGDTLDEQMDEYMSEMVMCDN